MDKLSVHGALGLAIALLSGAGLAAELGDGHHGPLVVSGATTAPRPGVLLADAPAGGAELQVAGGALRAGDLAMVWRSVGVAPVDDAGVRADHSDLGTWEFRRVLEVLGDRVVLKEPLVRAAAAGSQVVRVFEATTVTITDAGTLSAPAFDGTTGGILVVLATGAFVNDGLVTASAVGFQGGTPVQMPTTLGCSGANPAAPFAAMQGRGVFDSTSSSTGNGANSNGGGGGACRCAGGGGGANVGRGGKGGASNDGRRPVGGEGGRSIVSTPGAQLFAGGGGGAGWTDWDFISSATGAPGGGVIFIQAARVEGEGRYEANGRTALDYGGIDYGLGGGGAGGSIVLASASTLTCRLVRANGGGGGGGNNYAGGMGGGGGGGLVVLQGLRGGGDCPGEALAGLGGRSQVPGSPTSSTAEGFVGRVAVVTQALGGPPPPVIEVPQSGATAATTLEVSGVAARVNRVRLLVDRRATLEADVVDGRFAFQLERPTAPGVVMLEVAGLEADVEVSRSAVVHIVVPEPDDAFEFSSTPSAVAQCGKPYRYDDDGVPTIASADVVTWSMEPVPGALAPLRSAIDPVTGAVQWTPTFYDQGQVSFDLVAKAGEREARQRVTVKVDCNAGVGCGCSSGASAWPLMALLLVAWRRTRAR